MSEKANELLLIMCNVLKLNRKKNNSVVQTTMSLEHNMYGKVADKTKSKQTENISISKRRETDDNFFYTWENCL